MSFELVCAACGTDIAPDERAVFLYGQVRHQKCRRHLFALPAAGQPPAPVGRSADRASRPMGSASRGSSGSEMDGTRLREVLYDHPALSVSPDLGYFDGSMTMESGEDETAPGTGSPGDAKAAISDGVVRLFKEFYGRGPERTKTYVNGDLVVCLLRGGFTPVEQTLLDGGHGDEVVRQRMLFQEVMRTRFEEVVETAMGRKVVAFMSDSHQEPDMICETFVLADNDLLSE